MIRGGVDPLGKHWKFKVVGADYLTGTISEGEPDERIVEVHGANFSGSQLACAVSDEGRILGGMYVDSERKAVIKAAAESAFDYQFADVAIVLKQWSIGDTVPDWETYETIS